MCDNRNAAFRSATTARSLMLASAGMLAMTLAYSPVMAQASSPKADAPVSLEPAAEPSEGGDTIVVTGSRIARDGYNAPTPVSVLDNVDIQAQAPVNIADFVSQLPAIANSVSPATGTAALSAGTRA